MMLIPSLLVSVLVASAAAGQEEPLIGESEKVYTLSDENTEIRGLAFDEISAEAPRLFVLDGSGKIFAYRPRLDPKKGVDELELLRVHSLPSGESTPRSPRGLAFTMESGGGVFYFLNWESSKNETKSQLWRLCPRDGSYTITDLSRYPFRIGDREVLGLALDGGDFLVCFDGSGYGERNLRVQRGIIRLRWNRARDGDLEFVRHMPDSGEFPSYGLACMEFEGARYLWATAGRDFIYCAQGSTGRGLFHFDRPRSAGGGGSGGADSCRGLAFGMEALWVPEGVAGPDRIHRVNVTRNPDAESRGPRILRHLIMTIRTEPETRSGSAGKVFHYYSRPYSRDQLHNQGIWPGTEKVVDVSGAPNATIRHLTLDPAGDVSSRQHLQLVEYADAPGRPYASRYEIQLWTNSCRKYVYPHRVDRKQGALQGTNYLEDDPHLYNLSDRKTYAGFIQRVKAHVEKKYGVPADLENPYWAARNALEYIQDHYYYPNRQKRKPAAVDYRRKHYDANPGNLKIELSARPYDKSQIIACSGTSVMMAGAMRHLGIPSRWLGTGTEKAAETWDTNGNGLLDEEETAPCTNGHRYTQVWLGSHYGWICFDATPTKPDFNDYDPPPPIQSRWRYMNRAAAGHRRDRRIVFNVGSTLIRPLYRDFEYDEKLAVDNNCGGDQRYNLQGRFETPRLWKLARHDIRVKNICFMEDVALSGSGAKKRVTWKLKGPWSRDPGATLSIYLQQLRGEKDRAEDIAMLARGIPCSAGTARVDLSPYGGKGYRLILRKDGDPETGGLSGTFEIESSGLQ